jgi:hypothetical protein
MVRGQGEVNTASNLIRSTENAIGQNTQCHIDVEEAGTYYWGPTVRKGAGGPTVLRMIFLSGFFHNLSFVQMKLFRSSSNYTTIESQFFRFRVKIFRRSAHAGVKFVFHWGLNPLSATLNIQSAFQG